MRQLIINESPDKNGLINISGDNFHYLRQVLRVKSGSMVNVRLSSGELFQTTVAKIYDDAKKITLQVCNGFVKNNDGNAKNVTRGVQPQNIEQNPENQSSLNSIEYTLLQFLPRLQKFELIVRQATECGVKNIVPVSGEYSEKSSIASLSQNKIERMDRIVKEARQQSGSPIQTLVHPLLSLDSAIEQFSKDTLCFVLSERTDYSENLFDVINQNSDKINSGDIKKVCIAVGSEGGISPDEISCLREKGLFHSIHFAVNILRCETASLYGIAAVQSAVSECLLKGGKNGN